MTYLTHVVYVNLFVFCVAFLDMLTEEEEGRVADAVNRYVAGFVGRGSSPSPEDILRFSECARIMMRNARPAQLPETPVPEQQQGPRSSMSPTGNCVGFP